MSNMGRKPNYKYKAAVLNSDSSACTIVGKYDAINANTDFLEILKREEEYSKLLFDVGTRFVKECRRINLAFYKRKCRLQEKIRQYLGVGQCIWLTLNFSNETLSNTSAETRRKYVQRYLKSQSDYYIGNIDFGGDYEYIDRHGNKRHTTNREHFHAIVVSNHIDMSFWNEHYGWAFTERIHECEESSSKLSKYVSKLTNHAIKESSKRCCYIYSRKKL